ncbi:hypothetical protein D7U89_06550 [Stenotrophomonas maltophilia]|uniref:DUF2268 domain-containing putative Zn-dependent protease n=1 Tax=Stenotrophomonas TaxID=40323 RepID=UPI000D4321C7|nr:DUF2268 domain-containing putative Zn-dependent protease [Stenotrophomonas maltophilia]MBA0225152.1 hypothetical protein [Stenotrophomonas maltophilia]MBA0365273.1 hypothetical protein [Stenotrophomonas maltophilia]MBA0403087.1 hypothetical protein [Stenotrophomonas maltophilia]MCF3520769.1 hypothetical protein [Stenotrophomonas maltophilia]PSD12783.1 hypothetical protein C7E14_16275 [Stenotrophomonas maltophilia]
MRLIASLLAALLPCAALAAPSQVVTDDIARFWATYDAVRAEPDGERRVALVQQRYIDPGSPGLHALMQVRHYTAREYAEAMWAWPRFWTSVRPLTANAQLASATLERDLAAFRVLYPALRPATITYAIGVLRTGGTTLDDKVLIGAEMALGDERVDVSELPEPMRSRLRVFYDSRPGANNAQNNLHEYVHTQQRETTGSLAQYAVREGVAEYVAERISGRRPALPLYTYGPAHEAEIRARFRAEMHGNNLDNWLYNSARNPFGVSDLGYYAGYRIAQEYMRRQTDERTAVARMIELDYADPAAVRAFIEASGWLQAR